MAFWSSLADLILNRPSWYRAMLGVGRSTIAEFPLNAAGRVSGMVIGRARREDELLTAPLSSRSCVWMELILEENRTGSGSTWFPLARQVRSVPFILADDRGLAIVEISRGCQVAVIPEVMSKSGLESPDDRERAILEALSIPVPGPFSLGYRYRERAICIDSLIAVWGTGSHRPDGDASARASYREGVATILDLRGSEKAPLSIANYHLLLGQVPEWTPERRSAVHTRAHRTP